MRFLANDNVPRGAVDALRASGHDVAWVRTDAPGAPDEEVLRMSRDDDRVLLTFDKDFGELALVRGSQASRGVVLFRVSLEDVSAATQHIVSVIGGRDDWAGYFSVVEATRIRMRRLPTGSVA